MTEEDTLEALQLTRTYVPKWGAYAWRNASGQRHREHGPAIEWADGSKEYFVNGRRHRTDGPAVEYSDGSKAWYFNDKLHRTDGPAVEWADGTKQWFLNGKIKRKISQI